MDALKARLIELCSFQMILSGVSGVRMDDLAQSVGISKKTLYKYFSSKDELIVTCITSFFEECETAIDSIVFAPNMPFPEKLQRVVATISQMSSRMSPALMNDLRRSHLHHWNLVEQFRREQIFSSFRALIEEGVQSGFFVRTYNVDVIVQMYFNAINYTLSPEVLHNASFSPEEAFQTIFGILLGGILTDNARRLMYPQNYAPHQ